MKKTLSLVLVLTMMLSLFSFTTASAEAPVEINILAQIWTPYEEEQRDVFAKLEEACNVKLNIEWAPKDGFSERVYSTIATGKLPDLIARQGISESSMINEGAIVPITPYLDLAPNYVAAIGADKAGITNANDGQIYAISSIIDIPPAYQMAIRKDWLERVGLDVPETWEEWLTVWRAFRDQDANGNGDPNDEIPMSACGLNQLNYLMHAFKVYPDNYYGMFVYPGTSEVQCSYIADGMKDAMKYLKKLYDEGLLDPESFSQNQDTYTAKGTADTLGYLTVAGAFVNVGNELHWDYQGLAPFPDSEGNRLTNKRASCGGNHFAITSNCENPEAALRYVDYLYSEEGTTLAWMGVEGVSWEWMDEEKTTWHWLKPDDLTMNQFRHSYAIQGGVGYPSAHPIYFESSMWDRQEDPIEASLDTEQFRKPATDCGVLLWPTIKWSVEDSETLSFILPDCQTYYTASAVDFITGVRDIDADWDEYINTLKSMGIEEAIAMCQTAYDNYMVQINEA